MEIQVATDELSKALYRCMGVVEGKSTMPVLSSVLLRAEKTPEGGRLTVSAYDLEVGVSSQHACEVIKVGAVVLQAKSLYEIVRNLPENVAHLAATGKNNRCEITSGTAEFKVVGLAAEEFPALPDTSKAEWEPINAPVLLEMIESVKCAISADETRPTLNGVCFDSKGATLKLVATDGHRLSLTGSDLAGNGKPGVIIPRKGLMELRRLLLESGDEPSEIAFTGNSCLYRRQGLVLTMRLIDGPFQDYEQVVPSESATVINVARARLLETLRRVALVGGIKSAITVELTINRLRLTVCDPDVGEAKEDIIITYAGAPLTIGLNGQYMKDALDSMTADTVTLEFSDVLSPCVIYPTGDRSKLAVVMPMRV